MVDGVLDLIEAKDLHGARAAVLQAVRKNADALEPRWQLFELNAILGKWEAASAQLSICRTLDPVRSQVYETYGTLVDLMVHRDAVWRGEHPPRCNGNEWLAWERRQKLLSRIEESDGSALRDFAQGWPEVTKKGGACDGELFQTWSDRDSRFRFGFDVVLEGDYWWIRWDEVERIQFVGRGNALRDLVWRSAYLTLKAEKQPRQAFFIARYPGTESTGDPGLLLGRETLLQEGNGVCLATGMHLFRKNGEPPDLSLSEFGSLEFENKPPPG